MSTPSTIRESAVVATCDAVDYHIARLRRYLAHPQANEIYGDHILQATSQAILEAEQLAAMTRRLIETGYPF